MHSTTAGRVTELTTSTSTLRLRNPGYRIVRCFSNDALDLITYFVYFVPLNRPPTSASGNLNHLASPYQSHRCVDRSDEWCRSAPIQEAVVGMHN